MFEAIYGNEPIKKYLQKGIEQNQLPQTLLFAGIDGIGKSLFAKELAAHLLLSPRSADLHILSPEGKSGLYAIDTLREMMTKEHAAPFESVGKVFIIEDIDRMQPAAANALLKTLEEPTQDTTFILLSSHPSEILPTILSRCVVLNFQPLSQAEITRLLQERGLPSNLAKLSQGSADRAFELSQSPELDDQRKIVFSILSKRPSYPELSLQLKKLETLIEVEKEEDPVRFSRRIEYLLSHILMWNRDQELRKLQVGEDLLFFPEEAGATPFPDMEQKLVKARLSLQRNIKLSVLLEDLFICKS